MTPGSGGSRRSRTATYRGCLRAIATAGLFAASAASATAQAPARTLSLREAVEIARRENPGLRSAQLQSAQADSQVAITRSTMLPQVSVRASNAYYTSSLEGLGLAIPGVADRIGPTQQFDARPTITQNLIAPALRGEARVAAEAADEQRWREQASRESVTFAVIEAYLRVLESEARLDSARARLKTSEALLDEARRYMKVGTASHLDESRASVRCEMERVAVIDLGAERAIKKAGLLRLLGLPPSETVELSERFDPPSAAESNRLVAAASDARWLHPDLKAAEARVKTFAAERQRAASERLPTVAVAGDFGLFGRSAVSNLSAFSVRAMVSLPIYEGGRISAQVQAAALKTMQAEEAARDVRLQVEQDVQVAKIQLDASRQSHEAAAAAVAAAQTAVQLAQARFLEGLSTNVEVVTAQESLATAEAAEIGRRYVFYMARATLAKARGDVMAMFNE